MKLAHVSVCVTTGAPDVTCPAGAELNAAANPHVLTGALVNGPQKPDDAISDIRTLPNSQVSLWYNSGFTGAVPLYLNVRWPLTDLGRPAECVK